MAAPERTDSTAEIIDPPLAVSTAASDTVLMGRFGSFFLTSNRSFKAPYKDVVERIAQSLEEDARVVDVHQPDGLEDDWCAEPSMFPAPASKNGVVSGADALTSLVVNRGLAFSVRVPEKNQPKKRANDKVPAEYQAIWDGILILVTWRIPTSTSLPLSGGHVVAEILSDALARLNFSLYVQGCNPVCTHGFAHTDIRFIEEEDFREAVDYTESSRLREVHALVPPLDDQQLMEGVFSDLRIVTHRFSLLKNLGRRILEAERDGHKTLESLMEINYMRATLPTLPLVERYRKRWETRGWLPKTRLLIARAWMGLAYIESLRQEWNKLRLEFERNAKIRGRYHLFVRDYADEVDRVKSLDLELMRSGLQEIAERLDSRALLRVTATAAIAGAVAGGIVGAIAGSSF